MVRVNINLDRLDAKRGGVRSILVDSSTKFLGLNTYQVQVVQQSSWVYMGHSWVTLYAWWSSDSQAHPYRNSLKWHKLGGVMGTRLSQSVIKTFVHTWPYSHLVLSLCTGEGELAEVWRMQANGSTCEMSRSLPVQNSALSLWELCQQTKLPLTSNAEEKILIIFGMKVLICVISWTYHTVSIHQRSAT